MSRVTLMKNHDSCALFNVAQDQEIYGGRVVYIPRDMSVTSWKQIEETHTAHTSTLSSNLSLEINGMN